MAEINDISKLRPELLEKSDAELERMMTELRMAQEHKRHEARKKQVADAVDKINGAMTRIVEDLRLLEEHGFLSEEVKATFKTGAGVFAPHLRFKAVDADRVLARMAAQDGEEKPKRGRRKKTDS